MSSTSACLTGNCGGQASASGLAAAADAADAAAEAGRADAGPATVAADAGRTGDRGTAATWEGEACVPLVCTGAADGFGADPAADASRSPVASPAAVSAMKTRRLFMRDTDPCGWL